MRVAVAAALALLPASVAVSRAGGLRRRAGALDAREVPHEGPEYHYGQYADDWRDEYKVGSYPRWEDTKSDTWRYDDTKAYQDHQSDGKASPGLTGDKVGAYLPADLPREMGHGP